MAWILWLLKKYELSLGLFWPVAGQVSNVKGEGRVEAEKTQSGPYLYS
jgi:hypothetical protein